MRLRAKKPFQPSGSFCFVGHVLLRRQDNPTTRLPMPEHLVCRGTTCNCFKHVVTSLGLPRMVGSSCINSCEMAAGFGNGFRCDRFPCCSVQKAPKSAQRFCIRLQQSFNRVSAMELSKLPSTTAFLYLKQRKGAYILKYYLEATFLFN